ncbi:MAG: GGDEF domain-containing protein [Wenzhouxiangellaceae bacterium]|nr:GGDEF domain-containing protein [Wenzhouxiangellaceae bacterium]MBS3745668.1 GGDEF domain-containing protein [Wenzhouxiangellaceae bacterium]MBS3822432.1 GGDEF domain-containing protein [Wenzhouxiangellaceae bacterium]
MNIEFSMLDMRTMAFASSVSGFLMAATMLGIYHAGMRARAMLDWLVAGLAFGFGYLLGNLALVTSLPVSDEIAISLANALISAGHAFVLVGVQRYLGQRTWTAPLLGVVGLLFVLGIAVEGLREALSLRILMFNMLHFLLAAWTGLLLWRSRRRGMRSFHRMAAAVLLGFAVVLAFRFASELVEPLAGRVITHETSQGLGFLGAMIFGFLLTMAFAVMMFREKQVELMDLAERDPLTGMNNRLSLDEIAEKYMQRADCHGLDLSVLLFDLDHFKRVNDEFGHQVGDRVLGEVARRINQVMRGNDVAFRFGGEEFLALLPGAALDQAEQVAERLRQVISARPIAVGEHRLGLTASFGVAQYMPGRETWDDCVRRVDEALYRSKRGGRDRISRHAPIAVDAV